jgi:P-type Mg2+ transporter
LALSAVRIARKKVIVKRLDAIQNLGAVSILCSDKTGTLTVDSVHVSASVSESGVASDLPVKLAYVNSVMQTGTRSPIDSAVVEYMKKRLDMEDFKDVNLEGWVKLGEIPFDSSRRLLSVLASRPRSGEGGDTRDGLFITKGAVEEVLNSCTRVLVHPCAGSEGEEISSPAQQPVSILDFSPELPSMSSPLTSEVRSRILKTAERLNEDGLRLIAVGCKLSVDKPLEAIGAVAEVTVSLFSDDESDLTFIGFLGFLDPPKEDAMEAIEKLRKLNVQVRILTGDVPAVAAKVARDLGILSSDRSTPAANGVQNQAKQEAHICLEMEKPMSEDDLIVTGAQLATLSKGEDKTALIEVVERGIIFAKLTPYQKLEVVEILRSGKGWNGGERAVAFLGDGVNDALAIRGADVGISVDSGTEIAKEAADVILLEKSLGVVAEGVVQGRVTCVFVLTEWTRILDCRFD